MNDNNKRPPLYRPEFEHDNCGIGMVIDIKGRASHTIVENALTAVETLEHRAGKDAKGETGDGVGIMLQISHAFFTRVSKELGFDLGPEREYAVGMFFFPQDKFECLKAQNMFETVIKKEGMDFIGWREVPVEPDCLGKRALDKMPSIWQCFVKKPAATEIGLDFDRKLYIARRYFEQSNDDTYVVSLSSRTIVYKGMFLVTQLRQLFPDLRDQDYKSAIGIVHSRFSTNTNPSWHRAHPNRYTVHNGEINTIKGNADRMMAREETMSSPYMDDYLNKVLPVINSKGSDSAMMDNTLEFMLMSGVDLPLAMMTLIPEPWENNKSMSQSKKDFYQYYATMMEAWDGPASIIFSDGDVVGAVLDRNGLRPSRYYVTDDDKVILFSEVGAIDIPPEKVVTKDRLRPGKMLLVDTREGRIISDDEIKERYAAEYPFGEWLDKNLVSLKDLSIPNKKAPQYTQTERAKLQISFGYTYDNITNSILPMAKTGGEPISAMGVDSPVPALSKQPTPLFGFFKQLFAQVTNPPIDAIREEIVTSTSVYLGARGNVLQADAENCKSLKIKHPVLTGTDILKIKDMKIDGFKVAVIPITYFKRTNLEEAMDRLFVEADRAFHDGANILILSDREVDENNVAIPALMAVAGLNKYLVRTKKRTAVSIILESGEPCEVHHFATLFGYGASAIYPYLAHDTIHELIAESNALDKDLYAAVNDYNDAILHGIIKIASKMGISTIQSYLNAQIFEAIGIDQSVVDKYFTGTVSRIGGIDISDIEKQADNLHDKAFDPMGLDTNLTLDSSGNHKVRKGKEEHLYDPQTIHLLQLAVRNGDYDMFKQYSASIDRQDKTVTLRSLLDFNFPESGIFIDEVESIDDIVKRFKTGAMSYGSISKEAHETLAIAMNTLKGKSNSGEGGESLDRIKSVNDEINRNSAIKQVASGRFGVTSRYLNSAKEIQIKMAQGAKPGEGGHLPGGKVYPWVAKTRITTPGVSLISPPPHHDIYSIEDLAQLIYDLKNANRDARISVKLVSEAGVGTVAAGVAKAGAQVVLISGYDGGTGAAPKSSIHNAGLPWELGLAETHQTLIMNGLRQKVVLETDGKLMTGRDVAIAALLGAEEFGFATAPLVSLGCVMMRVCNLDTCPVGIATQNPELRKRFKGKPEHVINFMRFIAEEMREYMAKLGVRTIEELVGRSDLLKRSEDAVLDSAEKIDLSAIIDNPYLGDDTYASIFDPEEIYDFQLERTKDMAVLLGEFESALKTGEKTTVTTTAINTDRTMGTILGSEITRAFDDKLEPDTFTVKCTGSGGQSFGAFIPKGLTMELEGDTNDYFGKGLSGGTLVLYPPKVSKFKADENIIVGNVTLYGATGGKAFMSGVAGERFCVRNSGATAVVEGVGDHGCEYMTGGRVVILGKTGKNFAAGMSGGVAYVLDENRDLYTRTNKELISIETVVAKNDVKELKMIIEEYVKRTGSKKGKEVLDDFAMYLPKFKKIMPRAYSEMLGMIAQMEKQGMNREEAKIEAFYAKNRKGGN